MRKLTCIITLICFSQILIGQGLENYKDLINLDDKIEIVKSNIREIKTVDLSKFWTDNPIERRYGFIGSDYRRLDIKFLSIIKNPDNPTQYFVYGKSRASKNICEFQGLIEIKESYYIQSLEYFNGNSGLIAGEYTFYETPDTEHTGKFMGIFVTYWTKSDTEEFKYLKLPAIEGNNQFLGTWTGYEKTDGITANWGDRRVPDSGDLDVGTSEFGINRKYQQYGWDSFIKAFGGGFDNETTEKAREAELTKWWKE